MKRILYIAPQPFFEVRGTPIATLDMLQILGKKYLIDFFCYPIGKEVKIKGVKRYNGFSFGISSVNIGFSLKKIFLDLGIFIKVLYYSLFKKYDVIHAVEESAVIGVFIKKIKKTPLVYDMDSIMSVQISETKILGLKTITEFFEKLILRNSDLVLGISPRFKDFCISNGLEGKFTEIWDIPHYTKIYDLDIAIKEEFKNKDNIVLYIGNGEFYQGIDLLENAANLLPNYNFFIIGTGKNLKENNITYIDKVPMEAVHTLLTKADVLVSPRRYGINTPMKIYSYMASGTPIVATDIPAHEILKDCAIIVKPDHQQIAKGIKEIINSEIKFKQNPKDKILKKYNLKALNQQVLSAYENLLDEKD